jgi:hypothetical protein
VAYRGRLIRPVHATLALLDTAATAASPGVGPVASGYDPDFREPVLRPTGPSIPPVPAREETILAPLEAQWRPETGDYNTLGQMLSGPSNKYDFNLLFHYIELEARGLIGPDGVCIIKPRDRLVEIRVILTGQLLADFSSRPVFCTKAEDRSAGLPGATRNLFYCRFQEDEASTLTT